MASHEFKRLTLNQLGNRTALCVYALSVGLPTICRLSDCQHLSVIKELTWNRLTHYFELALLLYQLRESSNQGIPFISGRGVEEGSY